MAHAYWLVSVGFLLSACGPGSDANSTDAGTGTGGATGGAVAGADGGGGMAAGGAGGAAGGTGGAAGGAGGAAGGAGGGPAGGSGGQVPEVDGCTPDGRTAEALVEASVAAYDAALAHWDEVRQTLYAGVGPEGVDFTPEGDSWVLPPTLSTDLIPILASNAAVPGAPPHALAVAGEVGGRFVVFGDNPLAAIHDARPNVGEGLRSLVRASTRWAAGDREPGRIAVAYLGSPVIEVWDSEASRAAIAGMFPEAEIAVCPGAPEGDCLTNAEVLFIGSGAAESEVDVGTAVAALKAARAQGVGIMFLRNGYGAPGLDRALLAAFGLRFIENYDNRARAAGAGADTLGVGPLADVRRALASVIDGGLAVDDYRSCLGSDALLLDCPAPAAREKLFNGLAALHGTLTGMDDAGARLCASPGEEALRLAVAAGDAIRETLSYPVRLDQDAAALARAVLADATVVYGRSAGAAQRDLGTFVCDRGRVRTGSCPDYAPQTLPLEEGEIRRRWARVDTWTATGFSALPGVPFRVRRTDDGPGWVRLRLNSQDPASTRALNMIDGDSSYDRPLWLGSPWLPLVSNEDVVLTSPYGGPIYLVTEGRADDAEVAIELHDVVRHPLLDLRDAASIADFPQAVTSSPTMHADIVGDAVEIHLRKDKFLNAIAAYRGDANALVADLKDGLLEPFYGLAGRPKLGRTQGESLSAELRAHCEALGWRCDADEIHGRPGAIQHMAYDENANCGSGCSGNPITSGGDLDPLGWLESHELGHNEQLRPLEIHWKPGDTRNDWAPAIRTDEASNNVYPYFTYWNARRAGREAPRGVDIPFVAFRDAFAMRLTDEARLVRRIDGEPRRVVYGSTCGLEGTFEPDEALRFGEAAWADSGYAADNPVRVSFYVAPILGLHGQTLGDGLVLENGFDLFTLLNLAARQFLAAAGDDERWAAERASLGFRDLPRTGEAIYGEGGDVGRMPGNDFLLVVLSYVSGLDFRPYFESRGVGSSDLARDLVQAHVDEGRVTGEFRTDVPLLDDLAPADLAAVQWIDPTALDARFANDFGMDTCPACEAFCRVSEENGCGEAFDGDCLSQCALGFYDDPFRRQRVAGARECLAALERDAPCEDVVACLP